MAANEYYADTGNQNKDRLDTSPYSSSPTTDANKPLPAPGLYQGSFVPSHGIYNDEPSYASNHYSAQSIDNSYHQQSGKPNDDSTNTLPLNDSFSDNIPLTDRPQHGNAVPMPGGYDYDPERRGGKRPAGSFWVARPWFVYCMTAVHVAVFCFELAQNSKLTGSVIATKPQFNPMIGPSTDVLISIGARFAPCMRKVASFNNTDPTMLYPCPGRTDTILNCTLGEWCGFNGGNIPQEMGGTGPIGSLPNQWYRFIVPIFYHAGIVHLVLNMAMQILLGGMMEVEIGMVRFMIVYFCSGIFGFVLGGNLGAYGQPSVGASGSLFGIFSLVLIDILYTWHDRPKPGRDLFFLILDMVISFVLGLLPGIDNYAHIGGFICGISLGLALMRSPNRLRTKIGLTYSDPPYTAATSSNPYNTSTGDNGLVGIRGFAKQPLSFFKGRKKLWWAWWGVRAAMLTFILVIFIVLINNFYSPNTKECKWCRYLSCLPVNGWCDMYEYKVETTTTPA